MKTETMMLAYESPLKVSQNPLAVAEKTPLRIIHKIELDDRQFSKPNNQSVQNSSNWDESWFASYE